MKNVLKVATLALLGCAFIDGETQGMNASDIVAKQRAEGLIGKKHGDTARYRNVRMNPVGGNQSAVAEQLRNVQQRAVQSANANEQLRRQFEQVMDLNSQLQNSNDQLQQRVSQLEAQMRAVRQMGSQPFATPVNQNMNNNNNQIITLEEENQDDLDLELIGLLASVSEEQDGVAERFLDIFEVRRNGIFSADEVRGYLALFGRMKGLSNWDEIKQAYPIIFDDERDESLYSKLKQDSSRGGVQFSNEDPITLGIVAIVREILTLRSIQAAREEQGQGQEEEE